MFPTGKRGLRAEGASPTRTAQSRVPTGPVIRNGVACSQAVILPCNEIGSFSRVSQIECKHPFLPESEQNEAQGLCISVCVPEKLTEDAAPSSSKSAPRSCCEFSLRTRQHSLPLSRPVGLKLCKHAPSPRLLVARPVTARPWERLCPPHPVISALPSSRTRFTAELLTGFPARYWGRTVLRVDSTSLQPLKPPPHQGEGPPPARFPRRWLYSVLSLFLKINRIHSLPGHFLSHHPISRHCFRFRCTWTPPAPPPPAWRGPSRLSHKALLGHSSRHAHSLFLNCVHQVLHFLCFLTALNTIQANKRQISPG